MTTVKRIPILDGWRAMSILLVLAGHLLWLGPSSLNLNHVAGASGMALFFTLSGFLIVNFLYGGMPVGQFLVKRIVRIAPLAWAAMFFLIWWQGADLIEIIRNLLFVANLPPASLLRHGEHLWSLCIEMQFYAVAALIAFLAGPRGMWAIPFLCVGVTIMRIAAEQTISIVTWHRVDEILAGGILALAFSNGRHKILGRVPLWLGCALLFVCSHPATGALQYLRPYAAAVLVGITLASVPRPVERFLVSRPMVYIATISYGLYVIHAILAGTWLGSGDTIEKYVKRPLLFAATFALAHLSNRYMEQPLSRWVRNRRTVAAPDVAAQLSVKPDR